MLVQRPGEKLIRELKGERDMPKVGKKHFSYSAKGLQKARDYAKKSGKSMTFKKGGTTRKK